MREFFSSWKFKVILGVVALLLGLMVYAATTSNIATSPESLLGAITAPFQRLTTNISNAVESQLDKLINADKYYKENQLLKEQLAEIYGKYINYEDIKAENEQLREVIGLKEDNSDYEFSPPSSIIGRQSNDIYGSFVIDKGSLDGISAQDPVITSAGLVGRVIEVAPTYSRVATLLSPDVPVGVYCVETKDTGILMGDIDLASQGKCKMVYIDKDSKLKRGDIVVTSGRSGVFPDGIMVGTVEDVYIEDTGLSKSAIITPVVNSGKIKDVFVITSFEGQGLGYE